MRISLQKERLTSEGKAQAEVVETDRRAAVGTIRHAAFHREAEPATATEHAVRSSIGIGGIGLRCACVTTRPIIITPFEHVAAHIVDAQLVGRLGGYRASC